jgi:hypothetical protein
MLVSSLEYIKAYRVGGLLVQLVAVLLKAAGGCQGMLGTVEACCGLCYSSSERHASFVHGVTTARDLRLSWPYCTWGLQRMLLSI